MCHGTADEVVKHSWGRSSFELLKDHGCIVDFKSYKNMGHSASDDELMDVLEFIKNKFKL
jgi:predicted esterase